MICLEVQALASGALAGALEEPVREAVRIHLGECAACRSAETRLRAAWEFLGGMEPPPLPLDLKERLQAARPLVSRPPPVPQPPAPRRRGPHPLTKLAWALLALGAGFAVGIPLRDRFRPPPPPPMSVAALRTLVPAPPTSWRNSGEGVMHLAAVPGAEVWASPFAQGALAQDTGRLFLSEGAVWGAPLSGETLRLELAGWQATVLRGTFSASVQGGMATLTCHEGFLRLDGGPGFEGPRPDYLRIPEGSCVLLVPGRRLVGPRPARAPYPGDPGGASAARIWWDQLSKQARTAP